MAQTAVDKTKSVLGLGEHSKSFNLVGEKVGATGFGLMGMTWRPEPQEFSKSFETMKEALKLGANFWNGGEIYGTPEKNSLHLLHDYFTKYPEDAKKVVISIKGGGVPGAHFNISGSTENTKRSIDECLKTLDGKKFLDIFECARVDPKTPVEVTMRAAKEYIDAGKLGGVSLSECGVDTIRRAAKIVKVAAVEIEYSLWATEAKDNGIFAACKELDIPIIAYSPLGRGFLTGQIKSINDIPEDSLLRRMPRFQPDVFDKNLELVDQIQKMAERKGCTAGQIAIGWVKAESGRNGNPVIIPIPGTLSIDRLHENMKDIDLSENDVKEIDGILAAFTPDGGRYPPGLAELEFGNSPPEQ